MFELLSRYVVLLLYADEKPEEDGKAEDDPRLEILVKTLVPMIHKSFEHIEKVINWLKNDDDEDGNHSDQVAAVTLNMHGGFSLLQILTAVMGHHLEVDSRL